jgi:hypothetical protein
VAETAAVAMAAHTLAEAVVRVVIPVMVVMADLGIQVELQEMV